MKTREMKYSDYGVSQEEISRLKAYCKTMDAECDRILHDVAYAVEFSLADELYASIKTRRSYETLDKENPMPISKGDFYGYRRKCLCVFRDILIFCGKWK